MKDTHKLFITVILVMLVVASVFLREQTPRDVSVNETPSANESKEICGDRNCVLIHDCCGEPLECANSEGSDDYYFDTHLQAYVYAKCQVMDLECEITNPLLIDFIWPNRYCACDGGKCEMKLDRNTACYGICDYFDCDESDLVLSEWDREIWAEYCGGYSCECFNDCAEEGETWWDDFSKNKKEWCEGLKGLGNIPLTPLGMSPRGAGGKCYDLKKGVPECQNVNTNKEGWYYPGGELFFRGECSRDGIIFQKLESWGPCPPEGGDCTSNITLYRSGMVDKNGIEFRLGSVKVSEVRSLIKDSSLIGKDCGNEWVTDYFVTYTVSLNGRTGRIGWPSSECKKILDDIEALMDCASVGEQVYPAHWGDDLKKDPDVRDECCLTLKRTGAWAWIDGGCEQLVGTPLQTCISCGDGVCENTIFENYCSCPKDCPDTVAKCAGNGERVTENPNIHDWYPDECCRGLKKIHNPGSYTDARCIYYKASRHTICAPCGNGVCDKEIEDSCTCVKDCGTK